MAKLSAYMTIGDAAEYLGVSKDTLRRWDRAKKLVARRNPMSRYRLYSKKDLDDLLARLGRQRIDASKPAPRARMAAKKDR